MKTKTYRGRLEFKADADKTGEFRAEFATLNVVDHDQDVTEAGAFHDGQETMIEAWNHNYGELPVGKGVIREEEDKAVVEGRFFLDTQGGLEHYKTVKALGDLQQWSYTFEILNSGQGKFEDQDVRFLRDLDVWGVAPVERGAGIDTRTVDIKGMKPYPNEHACRLRDPDDFENDSFRRVTREHEGKKYAVIMGRLTGEETMTEQAYRYPTKVWDEADARAHCRDHEGRFEPATGKAALASHSTATTDAAWDGPANEARVRSGENDAYYRRIYAWRDPDGDPAVKSTYKFVHHMVAEDGTPGAANIRGCQTAIGVLNGGRGGTTIPDADRQGVWNHVARHLRDADLEPAELKAAKSGARHTAKEYEMIQSVHDMAVELGATCSGQDDSGDGEDGESQDEAGDGKSRVPGPSTLAARVAMELLEAGF